MLIHYLEFNNFLPFHGVHRIDFPTERNTDQPFTLILSPTNTGKTTTIRALRYLLYGRFNDTPIGIPHTLINHAAKMECAQGKRAECWVRAKITFGPDKELWFQRRISAARTGEGMDGFAEREHVLERIRRQKSGTVAQPDDGEIAKAIKRYAPETLFNLFIFAGEPGEGRIDPTRQGTGLDAELKEIFRIFAWDKAIDQLKRVRSSYESAMEQIEEGAQEAIEAWRNYETEKNRAEQWRTMIAAATGRKAELEAQIEAAEDTLSAIGPRGQEAENLQQELKKAEAERLAVVTQIERARLEIKEAISSTRGKIWLTQKFDTIAHLLPQKEIPPPSVPLKTLNQLLNEHLCLCGRPLDKECASSRKTIEKLIARLQRTDGSERLSFMLAHFSDNPNSEWRHHATNAAGTIRNKVDELDRLTLQERDLTTRVEQCARRVDEVSITAAHTAKRTLRELKLGLETIITNKGRAEIELDAQAKQVKTAKAAYNKASQSLPSVQRNIAKRNENCISRIDRLLTLLDDTQAELKSYLRVGLQEKISRFFDHASTNGANAVIGASLVPQYYLNGARVTAIGGGEKQMLELGYVVALSEIYHEISEAFKHNGLVLDVSPDLAIVADAPFSNTADTFNNQIIDFLSHCSARQKILLMHKTQWDAVKDRLEPLVSTVFGYKLHSPNPPINEEEYRLNIKNQEICLLQAANNTNGPTSEILKIFPHAN